MTLRLGDSNILLQPLCEYLGDDFVLESALVITVDPATEAQNAHTDTDGGERVWRDGLPLETNPAQKKNRHIVCITIFHKMDIFFPQKNRRISCHPFPRKTRAASQCTFPYSSFERPSRRCPSASRHGEGSVACCACCGEFCDFHGDLMVIFMGINGIQW